MFPHNNFKEGVFMCILYRGLSTKERKRDMSICVCVCAQVWAQPEKEREEYLRKFVRMSEPDPKDRYRSIFVSVLQRSEPGRQRQMYLCVCSCRALSPGDWNRSVFVFYSEFLSQRETGLFVCVFAVVLRSREGYRIISILWEVSMNVREAASTWQTPYYITKSWQ